MLYESNKVIADIMYTHELAHTHRHTQMIHSRVTGTTLYILSLAGLANYVKSLLF